MREDFMPRFTTSVQDREPHHSPAMLALLDLAAQPTVYVQQTTRAESIMVYKIACGLLAERVLEGGSKQMVEYWVRVRDQLVAKYEFTEAEINDGSSSST